ncbi:Protein kinase superfamily protein [Euphorbia peplus]|nr:Protein kinase superfamily protein [Euphorbia peplus]
MITRENPYTKPSILTGVSDPKAKHLIETCLSPSSTRLSAMDLLEHPFLVAQSCKETVSCSQLSDPICKQVNSKLPIVNGTNEKKKKIVQRASSNKKNNFWYGLRGMQVDERTILFTLDIVNKGSSSAPQNIEFPYHIDSDTSVSVAAEMTEQLDFLGQDVAIVVHLIDAVVTDIVKV